jgi:hypothetical protein
MLLALRHRLLLPHTSLLAKRASLRPPLRSFASISPPPAAAVEKATPPPLFDTHKLVTTLKGAGFSELQAESVMMALVAAMSESQKVNLSQMASKVEFTALQSEQSEKVFNMSLKFDMVWCACVRQD